VKTLIVEDDTFARSLLAAMVSDYGICHIAPNGQQALEMIEQELHNNEPYHLILLDIMMPVLDGQQTLIALRKLEESMNIAKSQRAKVIMVTAIDDRVNIMKAFQEGQCEAYMTKPVVKEKLIQHIRQFQLI